MSEQRHKFIYKDKEYIIITDNEGIVINVRNKQRQSVSTALFYEISDEWFKQTNAPVA